MLALAIAGAGNGVLYSVSTSFALTDTAPADAGEGSALLTMLRLLGLTLSVALSTSLMLRVDGFDLGFESAGLRVVLGVAAVVVAAGAVPLVARAQARSGHEARRGARLGSRPVILSDVTIREELAAGRIVIEPLSDASIQPSSVDLHCDRYFRVFRNDTTPYIDPKLPQEDLTELVEIADDGAFILHPGEFVLGSTLERVALPDDLVARLEGKSSLGRLGLLIHSSLPASEPVLVLLPDGRLEPRPIGEIVAKRLDAKVVAFDPKTFDVGYHDITGWYEGPPDRIFEVVLGSGRRVRVTAGHNLFTLGRDGTLAKVRTGELRPGTMVAIPKAIPELPASGAIGGHQSEQDLSGALVTREPVATALRERPGGEGLTWDAVVEVRDTGTTEPIFDLEVRPSGRKIENFLAGHGGVFVSNTAGFVDAGWDGHLTLELSNVANLPIAIYPGMKIGQISFLRMTSAAANPYGSKIAGSKYQGQRGPTPSRYYLNFRDEPPEST